MRKTAIIFACCILVAISSALNDLSASQAVSSRPNIVIVLADDMGYGDVSVLNRNSRIPTPNLDKLAKEGLVFTDAHSSGSYCVPSRYGLLTGRYMWRTRLGAGGNLANFAGTLIEPGRKTLPSLLRGKGYYTGLIGKWHQGIDWKLHDETARDVIRTHRNYQDFSNIDFASPVLKGPKNFGFDYSFGTAGSAEMNPGTFIKNNRVTKIPTLSTKEAKKKYGEWFGRDDNIIAEGYTMDRLVPTLSSQACEFVERATRTRPEKPFFLYYAMTTPHNPIVPDREFVGTSRAGAYGDFVVELDHHVGKLLQIIDELGIQNNTIVIFTSDNGPVNRTKRYPARWVRGDTSIYGHDSNGPFQGWKGGLLEGGHRVPFFIRWPDQIKPGRRCPTTILFNDVLPTLTELLNIKLDNQTAEDGQSFLKALTGEKKTESFHEAIVHNHSNGTFAIRKGPFKLIINGPKTTSEILDDDATVSFVLYDLNNNIEETIDVSEDYPKMVQEMHALLKKYIQDNRSISRK